MAQPCFRRAGRSKLQPRVDVPSELRDRVPGVSRRNELTNFRPAGLQVREELAIKIRGQGACEIFGILRPGQESGLAVDDVITKRPDVRSHYRQPEAVPKEQYPALKDFAVRQDEDIGRLEVHLRL